ncbi:MAG: glycosyltransferase family 39 protein, partial [Verrucomicrobiota bacterium]
MDDLTKRRPILSRRAWILFIVFSLVAASWSRAIWVEDTGGYYRCAVALLEGDIYPTDNNYFAYPLLIALSILVFGKTLLAVHFAPFLCAFSAPVLLVKIALRLGLGGRYAFMAGVLLIVYPVQQFYVNRPLTEALFVFFLLVVVWIFVRVKTNPRSWALFLPALSWLLLIRYDAILFSVLAVFFALWMTIRAGQRPWKWISLGLILAVLMQVPFAMLNRERANDKIRMNAELNRPDLTAELDRFFEILPQRMEHWKLPTSEKAIPLARERIQAVYDEVVSRPRPPLVDVLGYFRPLVETPGRESSSPAWAWLPGEKIKAWLNVGKKNPGAWLGQLALSLVHTFPPGGVLAVVSSALLLGTGLLFGIRHVFRQPSTLFLLLVAYFCLYSLFAVFIIQGSILRHLSRLAPITILLVASGWPHLTERAKNHFAGVMGILLISCLGVNISHRLTRRDLVTRPLWEMLAREPSLGVYPDDMTFQDVLEYPLVERLRAQSEDLEGPDNFARLNDFSTDQDLLFPENTLPRNIWFPEQPGRLGLRGSMAPVEWVQVFDVDRP